MDSFFDTPILNAPVSFDMVTEEINSLVTCMMTTSRVVNIQYVNHQSHHLLRSTTWEHVDSKNRHESCWGGVSTLVTRVTTVQVLVCILHTVR